MATDSDCEVVENEENKRTMAESRVPIPPNVIGRSPAKIAIGKAVVVNPSVTDAPTLSNSILVWIIDANQFNAVRSKIRHNRKGFCVSKVNECNKSDNLSFTDSFIENIWLNLDRHTMEIIKRMIPPEIKVINFWSNNRPPTNANKDSITKSIILSVITVPATFIALISFLSENAFNKSPDLDGDIELNGQMPRIIKMHLFIEI